MCAVKRQAPNRIVQSGGTPVPRRESPFLLGKEEGRSVGQGTGTVGQGDKTAESRERSLQTGRRATTDAAHYRLCEQFDRLMERGGDRRSEEARSKMQRCKLDRGASLSARRTAQIIRCSHTKVDKIRKIRRDGWPELQEDVRNDVVTISMAYKLIRDMEIWGREICEIWGRLT